MKKTIGLALLTAILLTAVSPGFAETAPPIRLANPYTRYIMPSRQQADAPAANETAAPAVAMPEDVALQPDQAVMTYLIKQNYFAPFPDNRFHPDASLSRADFVTLLYRASGLKTPFISEFPYYRDVPADYWAYYPIEAFRMHGVLGRWIRDGFFHPDKPISRLSATMLLSRTFPRGWLTLTSDEAQATLKAYGEDPEKIPAWARDDVARAIYAGFLLPVQRPDLPQGTSPFVLDLQAPITRMDAARMVYRRALAEIDENQTIRLAQTPWIPPGIKLVVSPTSAISQSHLFVNATLYFALVEEVTIPGLNIILPRGTRLRGKVIELGQGHLQALVMLDKANLPSGESYRLVGQLPLQFSGTGDKQGAFLVPGQRLELETQPPQ